MNHWGKLELTQIDSRNFWCLYNELCDDNSGFLYNRRTILEAYKEENLYGLKVNETDEMYNNQSIRDTIFCNDSFYLLPCFCVKENNKAIILWTHTRARKMGFAKKLIQLLDIEYAINPLKDSIEFWKKCNIKMISY